MHILTKIWTRQASAKLQEAIHVHLVAARQLDRMLKLESKLHDKNPHVNHVNITVTNTVINTNTHSKCVFNSDLGFFCKGLFKK